MNKMLAMIVFLVFGILLYIGYVIDTYKPMTSNVTTSKYTPEKVTNKDLEQYGPVLPELSDEEIAVTDSLIKNNISTVEQDSERKSVEAMIKRVDDILTGKVQQDTISFNYTTKGIEIINPYTK